MTSLGAYGVPQPWYFFVKKSYWLGQTSGVYVPSTSSIEMQQSAAGTVCVCVFNKTVLFRCTTKTIYI